MSPLSIQRLRSHRLAVATMVIAAGMVPWIIFLALTLPRHYQASHWNLLWIGFDVALIVLLVLTALAAWRQRLIVAPLLLVTATLLVCDAWFDVVTSFGRATGWVSILTAIGAELPLAAACIWLSREIVLATVQKARLQAGDAALLRNLRELRVLSLETDATPPHYQTPSSDRPH